MEFAIQDKLVNVKVPVLTSFVILMQQTPPTRSSNRIKTDTKISLQLQSEAGLVFGKKSRTVGATGRHFPISHFIGAITVIPALNQRLIMNPRGSICGFLKTLL